MSKLPFMKFWVGDYLSDTNHLSTEEHGAYFLIILDYWSHRCGPKYSEKILREITKTSAHKWNNIKPNILEYFEIKDGRLFQSRIEEELKDAKKRSEQARDAVSHRQDRQPTSVPTDVQPTTSGSGSDNDSPKPLKPTIKKENIKEYISLTKEEYKELVEKFGKKKADKMIEIVNNYKGSSGKEYQSDYHAILQTWVLEETVKLDNLEDDGTGEYGGGW